MTTRPGKIQDFWQAFVRSDACPPGVSEEQLPPAAWFGDSPELADELGRSIFDGVKTATCGALWEWEADGDPLPKVGDVEIVLDGQRRPFCVMQTTEVTLKPFNEVDAAFAYDEGEGDRSLAAWRQAHWRYFSRVLTRIGRTPEETMRTPLQRL